MTSNIANHPLVVAYIDEICAHVKAKDVHEDIKLELLGHLTERMEERIESESLSEEDAIQAAVEQMGDAKQVGIGLNAAHKPKPEWSVIGLIATMIGIALFTILFALPESSQASSSFLPKVVYGVIGGLLLLVLYFANYRKLLKLSWPLYWATAILMALAQLYGPQINGSRQWIVIGPVAINIFSYSPYLLIVALAGILYMQKEKARHVDSLDLRSQFIKGIKQVITFILIPAYLYMGAPELAQLAVYSFGLMILLILYRKLHFLWVSIATMATAVLFVLWNGMNPYRLYYIWQRFAGFWGQETDTNYQTIRSMEAIQSGGMWGQGIGVPNTRLPFSHSEMMYSYLIYSLGWVFGALIAFIVLAFIVRIVRMGFKTADFYGRGLVIGLCAVFGIRLIWNLLMCLGLLPIMGIELPFLHLSSVSVLEFALVGLMLNVYRRKDMMGRSISLQSPTQT
ncbi:FtsW/RodA/SpoVE family cell cycle protein [Paenibacillus paeoniae]|uniref:FtsW/RodA/SpoVE family cell cycle protein n=1 Tax=Paenibacillus paeoniae TaxID=2292705 RepID=A0A371PFW6_9BACL|nr:FtsW/RodA/SpoVE family cell cycle protein [Paenibacillus paeoniae]REK74290.1 FtsW/RodA/SpoVE family cell cycle protein [Paenibacillus paeoniae]